MTRPGASTVSDLVGEPAPAVVDSDTTSFAGVALIPLSGVDQRRLRMGRTAVEMLAHRARGRGESRHEVLAPTLVQRRSSRPAS